jgi:hypothetical protein
MLTANHIVMPILPLVSRKIESAKFGSPWTGAQASRLQTSRQRRDGLYLRARKTGDGFVAENPSPVLQIFCSKLY